MADDSYKALTHITLPFIEEHYAPGKMIPHERFEAMAAAAANVIEDRTDRDEGASPVWTAEDHVKELMQNGSISDDADAPLHPTALVPQPGALTVAETVRRAQMLVEELESAGAEVPAKLRDFAEMSDKQISEAESARTHVVASDSGNGGDQHV